MGLPDALDAGAIRAALAAQGIALDVEVRASCGSTNTELLERTDGSSPALLLTEAQTAGRGRRGRRWHASPGAALMFSIRWPFPAGSGGLAGLSLASGVGLAKALRSLGAKDVALKWPNDLLAPASLGGGKLGGILIETRVAPGHLSAVIGVGLNCRHTPGLEAKLKRPTASLEDLLDPLPARNLIAASVAGELVRTLQSFRDAGFGAFRGEWEAMHAHQGAPLKVRVAGGRVVSGIADGIATDGGLLLRTRSGIQAIHSGTVVRRTADRSRVA